jgi:hypothetical protein
MLNKFILPLVAAALAFLLTPSRVGAYGAVHTGYTHVGPNGAYHTGTTTGYGPNGAYTATRTTAVGPNGNVYRGTSVSGTGYGTTTGGEYRYPPVNYGTGGASYSYIR